MFEHLQRHDPKQFQKIASTDVERALRLTARKMASVPDVEIEPSLSEPRVNSVALSPSIGRPSFLSFLSSNQFHLPRQSPRSANTILVFIMIRLDLSLRIGFGGLINVAERPFPIP